MVKCLRERGGGQTSSLRFLFFPDKTVGKMTRFYRECAHRIRTHSYTYVFVKYRLILILNQVHLFFIILEPISRHALPSEPSTSCVKVTENTLLTEYMKHYKNISENATDVVTDTSDDLFFLYGKFTFCAKKKI